MLQYLIKFSISLAVLYIFYRAVLRPLTFYQCNRFYLLCYSLLSFVISFINITPWVSGHDNRQFINVIPAIGNYHIAANLPAARPSLLQRLTLTDWLLIIFCIGATVVLVRLIVQYLSLRRIRQKAVLLNTGRGVQLYETTAPVSPFSFGNAIYFNRSLHSQEELQRIIQHEFVHVKQKHTIDLITGELLCVVNWFNPFAWFIRHSIRQNLEFIADNNVVANGLDKKEYQYLLLKVVGIPQYSIAGNFNFSNLKKRIAMMNKMKSAKVHLTKFLFVLPLLVVLLLAFRNKINDSTNQNLFVFTGIIYDAKTSQPLQGVSVKEKYSGLSAQSDANGYFKIKVPLNVSNSSFNISCNYELEGYENTNGGYLSRSAGTDKNYADLSFVGMRKQNNETYKGIAPLAHYQLAVGSKNKFVGDPDYSFVLGKFYEYQQQKKIADKLDELSKDSKKPIWVIDGIPFAIGTGMRAWFDKKEIALSGFKVWVDGKIMGMDEANAQVNRDELVSVNAFSAEKSGKVYGINANLFILKHKAIFNSSGNNNDTVPPLPPPPPPATGEIKGVPPPPPASAKLPAHVKGISIHTDISDKTNSNVNTATVTLKNGTKEVYNLNDQKEKANYIKKYGELPAPPPPTPVPAVPAVPNTTLIPPVDVIKNKVDTLQNPNASSNPIASVNSVGISGIAGFPVSLRPLYIVDGVVQPQDFAINTINADNISSVSVLKDQTATAIYGDKGVNGVVLITLKKPLYILDKVQQPAEFNVKKIDPGKIESVSVLKDKTATDKYGDKGKQGVVEIQTKRAADYFPKDVLVIIDGKEIPAGSKIDNYVRPADIKSMNVLKDNTATIKYGDKGKKGVIEIKTKKPVININ